MIEWQVLLEEYKRTVESHPHTNNDRFTGRPIKSEKLSAIADNDAVTGVSATDEAINTTEMRLGLTLPQSYKEFLKYSNGIQWHNFPVHLLPVEDIDFVRTLRPGYTLMIDFDMSDDFDEDEEEESLESYDARIKNFDNECSIEDPVLLKPYFDDLIQVSTEDADMGVIFMNPSRTYDAEWEVYACSVDGITLYASFEEYLTTKIPHYSEYFQDSIS